MTQSMHHWIYRSPNQTIDRPPLSIGKANGCPFCIAREDRTPTVGERILFLSSDYGRTGVRVHSANFRPNADEFLVRMDDDPRGYTRSVRQTLYLFVVEPFSPAAPWMPQLSFEDVFAIHESLLRACENIMHSKQPFEDAIIPIVSTSWQFRLPVNGEEIWPMLAVHGFSQTNRQEFIRDFRFGFEFLVRTNGRAPIRKKRMPPLSKGRYLSENQRVLWLKHFGHNFGYDAIEVPTDLTS